MSENERTSIEESVENVVAKHSLRNLRLMLVLAFMAGGWATALQYQMSKMGEGLHRAEEATAIRVQDWSQWRKDIDQFRNGGGRFTQHDYTTATEIFNRQKPPVKLPSVREIQKDQ